MKAESVLDILSHIEEDELKRLYNMLGVAPTSTGSYDEKERLLATIKAITVHDARTSKMTVNETANYLQVNRDTVIRAIERGDIKATQEGRTWIIPKLQFLEKIIKDYGPKD